MKLLPLIFMSICVLTFCSTLLIERPQPFSRLKLARSFATVLSDLRSEEMEPCGLAYLEDSSLLFCNYKDIWHLSRDRNRLSSEKLDAPEGVPVWNPTGLFYKRDTNLLYVANYKGRDVLVLLFNPQTASLTLHLRITHPSLEGPENVAVDGSGNIFVADYDGGGLLKFDPSGSLQWRIPVKQAHGVACMGDHAFVTSLTDREVIKVDTMGNIIARQGSLGVSPGQYEWPVSLAPIDDNRLAVLDAHQGRITVLDRDMKVEKVLGGNGPGVDLMNFPYCIITAEDGYFVADTFKCRIIRLSDAWKAREQIVLGDYPPSGTKYPIVHGMDNNPYTFSSMSGVDIWHELGLTSYASPRPYHGGYNSIDYVGTDGFLAQQIEFDSPTVRFSKEAAFWYMVWAKHVTTAQGDFLVFGSPQMPDLLVVDKKTWAWHYRPTPLNTWLVEGGLRMDDGTVRDFAGLLEGLADKFQELSDKLASGEDRCEAFRSSFHDSIPSAEFNERFWKTRLSYTDAGRKFYKAFTDGTDLTTAAVEYLESVQPAPMAYLYEILAVRYMLGPEARIKPRLTLTSDSSFYPGHGISSALDSAGAADYAAAEPDQVEYGFKGVFDQKCIIRKLAITWFDSDNRPQDYEITLYDENQAVIHRITVAGNMDVENSFSLDTIGPVKSFDLKIAHFKGQQRLLLRGVRVYGTDDPF